MSSGGQERSDPGKKSGGQERSDPGKKSGGQERSDPGKKSGGQERSDPGKKSGGQERSDPGKKSALITGASGGIGSAIADALAPTHTLLLAGRPSDRLDAVATRLGATTWPLDLTDPDGIEAAAEPLAELDVLVHNAGVAYPGRFDDSTPEQWRACFEVNVTGAVALTQALLPALRAARGHVVFINSGAGLNASPGLAAYSASKFAQRAFADSLRADVPELRVTSVHPGRVDTEMQQDLVAYEGGQYDPAKFLKPETVARIVAEVIASPPDAHTHQVVVRPRG